MFCRWTHPGSLQLPITGILRQSASSRARSLCTSKRCNSIDDLRKSFQNPSSPFYIAPGTSGPSHPGEGFVVPEETYTLPHPSVRTIHTSSSSASGTAQNDIVAKSSTLPPEEEGKEKLIEQGFDPASFYEQKIVWGHMDSFQHVNNVQYLRFLESGRIHWMQSLAHEIGGADKARDMLAGKGISLILAEVSIKFRRPVLYPDTLIIAHRPHAPTPYSFKCAAAIWSNAQRTIVTTSDSTLVWYDYDRLKKCNPGQEAHEVLARRIRS